MRDFTKQFFECRNEAFRGTPEELKQKMDDIVEDKDWRLSFIMPLGKNSDDTFSVIIQTKRTR